MKLCIFCPLISESMGASHGIAFSPLLQLHNDDVHFERMQTYSIGLHAIAWTFYLVLLSFSRCWRNMDILTAKPDSTEKAY